MHVPFSYLDRQFSAIEPYLEDIQNLVCSGDFTLGTAMRDFEKRFAAAVELPYAAGVGSGTDALAISLKILGIGPGDEVITTPMTFIATVGAIAQAGATPVFVDSEDGFVIDPEIIEDAITPQTKAIVPVHYTGNIAAMDEIQSIAQRHGLFIVEDACQAIQGAIDGRPVGSWGETAAFSLHPLKNLNVWGDAGVIACRDEALIEKIRLYRNHGLRNRDEVTLFGVNSRLDTLQAVVGRRLLGELDWITRRRIEIARTYDIAFAGLEEFIQIPYRRPGVRHVFHLYMVRAQRRDDLLKHLLAHGVEAKIHYPVPVHLQPAARQLGYRAGDFPRCEEDCRRIITLPAHQHLTQQEIEYTIETVFSFYKSL